MGETLKEKLVIGKVAKRLEGSPPALRVVLENIIKLVANLVPKPHVLNVINKNVERLRKTLTSPMEVESGKPTVSKRTLTELSLLNCLVSAIGGIERNNDMFLAIIQLIKALFEQPQLTVSGFKLLITLQRSLSGPAAAAPTLVELAEHKAAGFLSEKNQDLKFNKWCLKFLEAHVEGLLGANNGRIPAANLSFLVERFVPFVMFSLRHRSEKVRESCKKILGLFIGEALASSPQPEESLFFAALVAGLGAKTAPMRVAAIMALKEVLTYAQERLAETFKTSLVQVVLLLIREQHKQTFVAVCDFVREYARVVPPAVLEAQIDAIFEAIFTWDENSARDARAAVKNLLSCVLKRVKYERLTPIVPEGFARLLRYVNQQMKYNSRK